MINSELIEYYHRDGTITAHGRGVIIDQPDGAEFRVRTQASTRHSRRHYFYPTYEEALTRAAHFHRTHTTCGSFGR